MENKLPGTEGPSPHAWKAPARAAHPYRAFAIRIGLGLAIVGFLLWHFDARPALRSLARERLGYFAATVAMYLGVQTLCGCRWQLLAAMLNLRATFSECARYYFIGMFTNVF